MTNHMKYLIPGALLLAVTACAPTQASRLPIPTPKAPTTTTTEFIAEDDPRWNCLTMGNRTCGPDFVPVTQELADALAEGAKEDATTYDWESCLVKYGDTTYIVCPDGYTETS